MLIPKEATEAMEYLKKISDSLRRKNRIEILKELKHCKKDEILMKLYELEGGKSL